MLWSNSANLHKRKNVCPTSLGTLTRPYLWWPHSQHAQKHLLPRSLVLQNVFFQNPSLPKILSLAEGVYLVTLSGSNGVNHFMAINATLRRIFDPAEAYALFLSAEFLTECVGESSYFYTVREARRVIIISGIASKRPRYGKGKLRWMREKEKKGETTAYLLPIGMQ